MKKKLKKPKEEQSWENEGGQPVTPTKVNPVTTAPEPTNKLSDSSARIVSILQQLLAGLAKVEPTRA